MFAVIAGRRASGSRLVRQRAMKLIRCAANQKGSMDLKDAGKVQGSSPEWSEIIFAVALALLDIFKAPPQEPTGADAPGLREVGDLTLALQDCKVKNLKTGETLNATQLLRRSERNGIFFLTHWADFNSWEVAQHVASAVRNGLVSGQSVCLVGIGSVEAGLFFSKMLDVPEEVEIFADETASCHSALHFSRGAFPQYASSLNPYLRVFLMLLGVGSPGTIRTVLGGYFGDRSQSAQATQWIDESLRQGAKKGRFPTKVPQLPNMKMLDLAEVGSGVWDEVFGKEGLRPMELATLRLQNMVGGIIANWSDLAPSDDELLVQQGGTLITNSEGKATFYFRDKGILTYVPMEEAIKAMHF